MELVVVLIKHLLLLLPVLVLGDEGPLYSYSACIGSGGTEAGDFGFMFKFDCAEGIIRIHRSISYAKPESTGCPEYYSSSRRDCCTYHPDDCGGLDIKNNDRHYDACNGKTSCWSPVTRMLTPSNCSDSGLSYPGSTNYMIMEYYCVSENSILTTPGNGTTNGSTVNIDNEDYPQPAKNVTDDLFCSVETSCNSTIIVTAVDVRYTYTDGVCDQRLHIVDEYGAVNAYTQCLDLPYTEYVIYESTGNFIQIRADPEDFIYWIKFQSSDPGATTTLSCGAEAKSKPTCIPAGDLGSVCSSTAECTVNNSICSNEVCSCRSGLTEYNGKCVGDEDIGGSCEAFFDCRGNAKCIGQSCSCLAGSTDVSGACVDDGDNGGVCNARTVTGCSDEKALCHDWVCQCITGFTQIDGTCKEGEHTDCIVYRPGQTI